MKLHELTPVSGSTSVAKRKGRGPGSGNGKTGGHGHKGQKARSGGSIRLGFEGGQMPLQRRLPKRGFNNIFAKKYVVLNLSDLNAFNAGDVVDINAVIAAGMAKKALDGLKVIGSGSVDKAITLKAVKVTAGAKEKIEAVGGKVEVM